MINKTFTLFDQTSLVSNTSDDFRYSGEKSQSDVFVFSKICFPRIPRFIIGPLSNT